MPGRATASPARWTPRLLLRACFIIAASTVLIVMVTEHFAQDAIREINFMPLLMCLACLALLYHFVIPQRESDLGRSLLGLFGYTPDQVGRVQASRIMALAYRSKSNHGCSTSFSPPSEGQRACPRDRVGGGQGHHRRDSHSTRRRTTHTTDAIAAGAKILVMDDRQGNRGTVYLFPIRDI